mmetsp:Transcript_25736/g.61062  ORF Transcript_25736/g.61062 Transcript_25736/m.61062 type:complete len:244 (-) Transcript_25736:120-851(-)
MVCEARFAERKERVCLSGVALHLAAAHTHAKAEVVKVAIKRVVDHKDCKLVCALDAKAQDPTASPRRPPRVVELQTRLSLAQFCREVCCQRALTRLPLRFKEFSQLRCCRLLAATFGELESGPERATREMKLPVGEVDAFAHFDHDVTPHSKCSKPQRRCQSCRNHGQRSEHSRSDPRCCAKTTSCYPSGLYRSEFCGDSRGGGCAGRVSSPNNRSSCSCSRVHPSFFVIAAVIRSIQIFSCR